jgi:glucose/arabinose dehydrogenase
MRTTHTLLALLLFFTFFPQNVRAQAPNLQLQSVTTTRLTTPTFATNANDGSGRMFVLEQAGRILVIPRGTTVATVFLDLTSRVITSTERGLLGLAFHPNFSENGRFFVDYTRRTDGTIVLAEYHVSATNPNVAEDHETILLTIAHPNAEHNGGMLAFGHDGFLYVSTGDGGNANDPSNHAQDLNSLLGKMLRLDIDNPGAGAPYSSPASNPFYGSKTGRDEIYAFGFRNPWRFSFDPVTEELYVGDVGQDAVEELDVVEAGGNYGWRVFEGWMCTNLGPARCIPENYISPIHTYVHTGQGGRCSITGGYVYRGDKQTLPFGAYIFGDYCTGEVLMFYRGEEKLLLRTTKRITSFGVDEEGELYVVGGTVDRIVNNGGPFTPATTFAITGGGGVSFDTGGTSDEVSIRHAQIHTNDDDAKTAGLAFITLRQNGVLINEAAVPATPLIGNGRFYGELDTNVDTGVAISNPDMARTAVVSFVLTDTDGNNFGEGVLKIAPGGQFVSFLDQDPFLAPRPFHGAVSFNSAIPVGVVALRGMVNERADFLTTTIPVTNLDSVSGEPVVVPQLAAGGGWTTEIVLLNPTEDLLSGTVRILSHDGHAQTVTIDGTDASTVAFVIAPRSSRKIVASGSNSTVTGSVFIVPDSEQVAPTVAAIYDYRQDGVTVSATGLVAGAPSKEFDIFTQIGGVFGSAGSIETGIAIANPNDRAAEVEYALIGLNGEPAGMSGKLSIAPFGQTLSFTGGLPGGSALKRPFKGVLHLSSSSAVTALAIRGRYNERGEFLISTTPAADVTTHGDATVIPHIVDGAGYATEIVIHDLEGSPLTGTIYFFDQAGTPIDPALLQAVRFSLPLP